MSTDQLLVLQVCLEGEADLPENPVGTDVLRAARGPDPAQAKLQEAVLDEGLRQFRRVAVPPGQGVQGIAQLPGEGFGVEHAQGGAADDLARVPDHHGQVVGAPGAGLTEGNGHGDEGLGVGLGIGTPVHVAHDLRIGCVGMDIGPVGRQEVPQDQAGGLDGENHKLFLSADSRINTGPIYAGPYSFSAAKRL